MLINQCPGPTSSFDQGSRSILQIGGGGAESIWGAKLALNQNKGDFMYGFCMALSSFWKLLGEG